VLTTTLRALQAIGEQLRATFEAEAMPCACCSRARRRSAS